MGQKQTKITVNLTGLQDMVRQMGGQYIARVGILGSKVNRTDKEPISNSELAVIHEFGSESRNIPPRSFLRMPLEEKQKDLVKSMGGTMAQDAFERGDYKGVFKLLGAAATKIVDDGFATGGFGKWAALKQQTIDRKGSSAILIDTGQLRRAVVNDVVKRSEI
jgi:phage gpG-like protein